jgi:hypothetical protein
VYTSREVNGVVVACKLCSSENQAEFTAEIMIHFSGLRHIENPGVLAFPKVSVCLDCGSSQFTIPKTELQTLREGIAPSSAA